MNKSVNNTSQKLFRSFLTTLGLSPEETTLFIELAYRGQITILSLSRFTGINRTKIYRLVERLQTLGIIQEVIEEHKKYLKAVDLYKLELLVKQKEQETQKLKQLFPQIISLVPNLASTLSQPSTKVMFYRGIEGIRQQGWNTLSAQKECVGYTYRVWTEVVGVKFAQEWAEEWNRRNLVFKEIWSDALMKSKKEHPELPPVTYPSKGFYERYISSKILDINHQIDIYNDVVSIYNWYEGEVFGVEIYNDKVAAFQKQLFEIVWKIAKPVK